MRVGASSQQLPKGQAFTRYSINICWLDNYKFQQLQASIKCEVVFPSLSVYLVSIPRSNDHLGRFSCVFRRHCEPSRASVPLRRQQVGFFCLCVCVYTPLPSFFLKREQSIQISFISPFIFIYFRSHFILLFGKLSHLYKGDILSLEWTHTQLIWPACYWGHLGQQDFVIFKQCCSKCSCRDIMAPVCQYAEGNVLEVELLDQSKCI